MALLIADEDIGGARLRMGYNTFHPDGTPWRRKAGERLSAAEVLAIAPANRRSMIANGTLEIFPKDPAGQAEKQERFIVQVKKDQFNVIEGRKLNDQPLTREQADELAALK